jgi:DNA-binding PadR family transcriptional regulator
MGREDLMKLPTTAYVLLGLLTIREMSGYDLKLLADRSIKHFYWSPTKSQIYSELRRLESHALVTMREIIQAHRPDKRLYSITPAGREAVQQWLESADIKPDTYKSLFLLKVFLGHLLPQDTRASLFEERRQQVEGELHRCEQQRHDLEEKLQGAATAEEALFSLLTLQHGIVRIHAELAWMQATLDQLKR